MVQKHYFSLDWVIAKGILCQFEVVFFLLVLQLVC
jgi:hypothetical protein